MSNQFLKLFRYNPVMAFITINRENFFYNLNQIAQKVGSLDKIAIVLKDNAYGHGLEVMAKLASEFGIQHAVVHNYQEAQRINLLFSTTLILGSEVIPIKRCHYAINSLDDIKNIPPFTKVELKVDTGMHRNGIDIDEIDIAIDMIERYRLKLVGLMTHHRSADELTSEFFWQEKQFQIVKDTIRGRGFNNIRVHSCNSSATLRKSRVGDDIVRVGISAYGYNELPNPFNSITLKPVLELYAKKVSSRVLKSGCRVGYGADFIAPKDMSISTYDIGYGDGWYRGDSQKPYITPDGFRVLGRVSMDLMTLNSSLDEVSIMKSAKESAKQFDTISYDIITSLSPNIPRYIV